MPEPHWTSYIGMATGIVGAITGVTGAIVSYVNYKKTNSLKSLDLRVELRKAINILHSGIPQIKELIKQAEKSRESVTIARGIHRSGQVEKWKEKVKKDRITVNQLTTSAPKIEDSYENLDIKELESKLVEVHRLQIKVEELRKKYDAGIQKDDEIRKSLAEDARAQHTLKQ